MNQKNISLILLVALSTSLFLTGCGNKTSENNNEQQIQNNKSAESESQNSDDNQQIQENVSVENETQNNDGNQQDKPSQSKSENIDYLESYTSVLSSYRDFANDYGSKRISDEKYMNKPWSDMRTISVKNDNWGYAFKDLNGNGINELLLLAKCDDWGEDDVFVSAIYSLVDNKPKLLDSFHDRYRCYIGENTYIYTFGSNSSVEYECTKCTISSDGASIKVLEKIESQCFEEIPENDGIVVKYYHSKEDGEKTSITELKFTEWKGKMPSNNKQSNLEFIVLV